MSTYEVLTLLILFGTFLVALLAYIDRNNKPERENQLDFLEKNEEELYVRELSMFLYGDSKWFEQNNYEEICTLIREAFPVFPENE